MAFASNTSVGTIEQPINLVSHSDPASIPLGSVVYEANYGYGRHRLISEPRPCLHGAMRWNGGSELDQNLANVFGISVEPEDGTSVPHAPVAIRLKAWKKPVYSPYSKEQVLAATLHCLIRSSGGTPKVPLIVKVICEDQKDVVWAKKYAKKYITRPDFKGPPVTPTKVEGTMLRTDDNGVTYVDFTNVVRDKKRVTRQPAMIATRMWGSDGASGTCVLIPVWVGSDWKNPLSVMVLKCGLYHDLFNPAAPIYADANVLIGENPAYRFWSKNTGENNDLSLDVGGVAEADLAPALYGAIVTLKPTAKHPLTITIRPLSGKLDKLANFKESAGWKETKLGNSPAISCEFVYDPKTGKLSKGSLPDVKLFMPKGRAVYVKNVE